MDRNEASLDLIDFGTGVGTPLMKPANYGSLEGTSAPEPQTHYVPADRLRKFEEFIEEPVEGAPAPPKYWSLQFFQPYFDVTTDLVVRRLMRVVKAYRSEDFFEGLTPDLYAPYWIITTLICVLTVSGNTANYLTLGPKNFNAHLSLLMSSVCLVYSLALAAPLAAFCLFKHSDSPVKFLPLLSLYCYSFLPFLPAVALASLSWLQWPVMLAACVWSFLLLYKNFSKEVESRMPAKRYLMLAVVLIGYLVFILTVNLSFLAIDTPPEAADTTNDNK